MAIQQTRRYSAYGLIGPTKNIFPDPIILKTGPATTDAGEIGQVAIVPTTQTAYMLTSNLNGINTWSVLSSGSGETLASLTVTPGPTSLTGALTQTSGNVSIGADAIAQTIAIGTGAAIKGVTIGSTTASSTLALQTPTGAYVTAANGISITTAGRGVSLPGSVLVLAGTGDPNSVVTAAKGSLFLRTDGSSASTRAYINSTGVAVWIAITTAS